MTVKSVRAAEFVDRPERTNLFGLDRPALEDYFRAQGESAFRARQIMQWVYGRGVTDFAQMTNLGKTLRAWLTQNACLDLPELASDQHAADETRKWLLRMGGGNAVETVYIPEPGRGTLCVSSQVGCAMDCSFCATGKQGLNRNLETAEIIGQIWLAEQTLRAGGHLHGNRAVTNVVFMGMGEPLANYRQLVPALRLLLDDLGFGLSKRRVTVSTSGLVPFMDRLRADVDVALAVSLHAPADALRDELVPINRKYPLAELMAACDRYTSGRDHRAHVIYEYVMLDGINDSQAQAKQLAGLLRDRPAKLNLIPFNPYPGALYNRPPESRVQGFRDVLYKAGVRTTLRRTRGDDIDAACGQLVGRVNDRQRRHFRDIPIRQDNAGRLSA